MLAEDTDADGGGGGGGPITAEDEIPDSKFVPPSTLQKSSENLIH